MAEEDTNIVIKADRLNINLNPIEMISHVRNKYCQIELNRYMHKMFTL